MAGLRLGGGREDGLRKGVAFAQAAGQGGGEVASVLARLLPLTPSPSQPLCLAAWLHDVIYDSRASDNEERSAEYAHNVLKRLGVSRDVREEVARLILLTRTHETSPDDTDGQILLDADLAILGEDEAAYDAYVKVYPDDLRPSLKGLALVLQEIGTKEPKAASVKPEQLVDTSALDALDREGFFKNLSASQ